MKINKTYVIAAVFVLGAALLIGGKLAANKDKFKSEVEISQRRVDKIPVSVDTIQIGSLSDNVKTTGTLEASAVLNLVSETQGKIIKIYRKKGDYVSAGTPIAKVDDEVISANVLTAEANYAQMQQDIERLSRLAAENAIAKRDLEQAQIGLKKAKADLITAKKALNNTTIKSPISGYINNDYITVGQLLGGGSPVCEIVDNTPLKLNVKISEYEVAKVKKGQEVIVKLKTFPDKKFTGRIVSIAEKSDMAMKFNIEIVLVNTSNERLRSGLYAEVELPVKNEPKIIISKECIVGSMENPVVYVADAGKAVKRTIIIGQSDDQHVEVLNGLSVNEQIITSGQMNLRDGDNVNIIK
jgi:RND family efflux transporter MFP subunit